MGRWFGKHIPDEYNPFWEEPEYKDQPEHWHWWHQGHEDGYQQGYERGFNDKLKQENLEGQIESLKMLVEANKRVNPEYDEWLKKELDAKSDIPNG